MAEPERISADEAYKKMKAGSAIIVCAYEDENKFKTFHLEGALSFNEFKSKLPSSSKGQEMAFYCAWPDDGAAAGKAALYNGMGYKNAKVLKGGVESWKKAGHRLV